MTRSSPEHRKEFPVNLSFSLCRSPWKLAVLMATSWRRFASFSYFSEIWVWVYSLSFSLSFSSHSSSIAVEEIFLFGRIALSSRAASITERRYLERGAPAFSASF